MDTGRRHPTFRVEDVGADGRLRVVRGRPATRYPPHMGTLRIEVGDLHFSARWEAAAPQTIEAIRRMLPIESKLIHCRWTGESTWIPYGDFRPGHRLREPHVAPGARACWRCTRAASASARSSSRTAACTTSSKVGQLAANHFASVVPRRRLAGPTARGRPALPLGRRPGDPDHRGRRLTASSSRP